MDSIALFGFGTVGKSVYAALEREMHSALTLDMIVVRDKQKHLSGVESGDARDLFYQLLEDDADRALAKIAASTIIIEVMGGTGYAWEVVSRSLKQGKTVITANKALVSKYMAELEELNRTTSGTLLFEASVAGGIPIVKSLVRDLAWGTAEAFGIQRVSGILNGTCNYILTEMERRNITYPVALAEAQQQGYAEADPSADVEGWDTRAKIQILQRLAYGSVHPDVVCEGITRVEPVDFEYAAQMRCKIKLVATAVATADGVRSWVYPTAVPMTHPIAATSGVRNIVTVDHATLGPMSMTGNGAGGGPTAHSVVSDLFAALRSPPVNWFGTANYRNKHRVTPMRLRFYMRLSAHDQVGIIASIGSICESLQISIDAILQNPVGDRFDYVHDLLHFVVLLNETPHEDALRLRDTLALRDWCAQPPFLMAMY